MSSSTTELIGFRSTIKRTSPRYRSDGLTQRQQQGLRLIRKEGSAVFQYLQSLIAAREQVRLKSDESLLLDRLSVFDRQIDIHEKYNLLLLSKDISAIAIFRGQRPYKQLPLLQNLKSTSL